MKKNSIEDEYLNNFFSSCKRKCKMMKEIIIEGIRSKNVLKKMSI